MTESGEKLSKRRGGKNKELVAGVRSTAGSWGGEKNLKGWRTTIRRVKQGKEAEEEEEEEEKGSRNREGSAEGTLWLSGEVEDEQALPAALCVPRANQ